MMDTHIAGGLEKGKEVPTFKKEEKEDQRNYRAVSWILELGKILEQIINISM